MKGIQGTSNKTYRQLMGNGLRFEIPKFQRDYTWESEHWDDLWQDIKALLSEEETEHYLGYLVLQTIDNKSFKVIDGQQRLTTFSLIILAVLKSLQDLIDSEVDPINNTERRKSLLGSYIGTIDPVTLISNNKIKLNRNSDSYYRNYLVLLKDLPLRGTNNSEKHLRECFNWYYNKIKPEFKTGEKLAQFIEDIVDKLFFTVIEVTDQLNAFKVFETINARGVQLSSADLLKNYFFSVVDESNPHNSEIEELEDIWTQIISKLGSSKLEDYLRYYWNSMHKTVSKKSLFKIIKNSIQDKNAVFSLTRDLLDTADLFMALQSPNDEFWTEMPEVRKPLEELKLFKIKQVHSLLISAYKNLDRTSFLELIKKCVVISFRYNVIGKLNPNIQEEVYNSISLKIKNDKRIDLSTLESIYVNDEEFEISFSSAEFTSRNHKMAKYILTKLEKQLFNNEISMDTDVYTIEHILPESADESWGDFSNDELKRSIYRLGNLTLLEKKLNRDLGVLNYVKKKETFALSNSKMTNDLANKSENWTESAVISRQKDFAKAAKTIWKINGL